jgi:FkbM family methyltransferase
VVSWLFAIVQPIYGLPYRVSAMKSLVQSVLQRFGLRLVRINGSSKREFGADVLFGVLQAAGFSPKHVVDVGANHGNWTRTAIRAFPDAEYTLIEPQDNLKIYIEDLVRAGGKIRWINAGASDKTETLPFHLSHRDDSSTFLPAGNQHESVPMKVWALDDLLAEYRLPVPQLVKIDAEGFDLKVLRGASSLLGQTDVFLMEAAVLCPFENSVAATVQFMLERGYRLIDITEINRSPKYNVLWLTELVFLRQGSPLLAAANSYE